MCFCRIWENGLITWCRLKMSHFYHVTFNPSPVTQPSVGWPFPLKTWWELQPTVIKMRPDFPLGCQSISLLSSNEAERAAQAAAFSWEETKHQPWRPKSSGMHQAGGGWQQEPPPTPIFLKVLCCNVGRKTGNPTYTMRELTPCTEQDITA